MLAGHPRQLFHPAGCQEKIAARRATEAANQISDAFEIARYSIVLLACEKTEILPLNLPFLQSLHVRVAKKLFGDGLQLCRSHSTELWHRP